MRFRRTGFSVALVALATVLGTTVLGGCTGAPAPVTTPKTSKAPAEAPAPFSSAEPAPSPTTIGRLMV
ncbi:MAG TPA: hypothetical protein VGK45_05735, partial [Thermoanaerobaculia bacterium]